MHLDPNAIATVLHFLYDGRQHYEGEQLTPPFCRQWATWQLPNGTRWCLWHAAHLSRSLRKELRAVTATRTCQGRRGQRA